MGDRRDPGRYGHSRSSSKISALLRRLNLSLRRHTVLKRADGA